MNTRTLQYTQTSVTLAVNVVSKSDRGLQFTVYTICQLAPILFTLWQLGGWLVTAAAPLFTLTVDGRLFHSILASDTVYLLKSFYMAGWVFWNGMEIITKAIWWGVS
jgi:hypothetical protein